MSRMNTLYRCRAIDELLAWVKLKEIKTVYIAGMNVIANDKAAQELAKLPGAVVGRMPHAGAVRTEHGGSTPTIDVKEIYAARRRKAVRGS